MELKPEIIPSLASTDLVSSTNIFKVVELPKNVSFKLRNMASPRTLVLPKVFPSNIHKPFLCDAFSVAFREWEMTLRALLTSTSLTPDRKSESRITMCDDGSRR